MVENSGVADLWQSPGVSFCEVYKASGAFSDKLRCTQSILLNESSGNFRLSFESLLYFFLWIISWIFLLLRSELEDSKYQEVIIQRITNLHWFYKNLITGKWLEWYFLRLSVSEGELEFCLFCPEWQNGSAFWGLPFNSSEALQGNTLIGQSGQYEVWQEKTWSMAGGIGFGQCYWIQP